MVSLKSYQSHDDECYKQYEEMDIRHLWKRVYLSNPYQQLRIKGRVIRAQPKFRVVIRAQGKHKLSWEPGRKKGDKEIKTLIQGEIEGEVMCMWRLDDYMLYRQCMDVEDQISWAHSWSTEERQPASSLLSWTERAR